MHFHCEIWFEEEPTDKESLAAMVDEVMAPFREMYPSESGAAERQGFWDWYQIGGRWKGVHDPNYDANTDPAHKEQCWLCEGTGKRPDLEVANGCNGCAGTGTATAWPTSWAPHPKDFCHTSEVADDFKCYTLIARGKAYTKDTVESGFDGLVKAKLEALGLEGGYLVTVDYHC